MPKSQASTSYKAWTTSYRAIFQLVIGSSQTQLDNQAWRVVVLILTFYGSSRVQKSKFDKTSIALECVSYNQKSDAAISPSLPSTEFKTSQCAMPSLTSSQVGQVCVSIFLFHAKCAGDTSWKCSAVIAVHEKNQHRTPWHNGDVRGGVYEQSRLASTTNKEWSPILFASRFAWSLFADTRRMLFLIDLTGTM